MKNRSLFLALTLILFGALGATQIGAQSTGASQGLITFASAHDGILQIYVMNADGSSAHSITTGDTPHRHPNWSPDGTRIAFDMGEMSNNIFIVDADGTHLVNFTQYYVSKLSDSSQPAWSPDGSQIAFVAQDITNARYGIYSIHVDGTDLTHLTPASTATDGQPAWSPDGSKIAFTSDRDGGTDEIYVMNADGSHPQRLTTGGGSDPRWSPDGTQIAYSSASDLFVMNADGSNPRNLTNDAAGSFSPSWSPDGTQIAFESLRDGNAEIYAMNADGSGAHNLTHQPGEDLTPAWQPAILGEADGGAQFSLPALDLPQTFCYAPVTINYPAGWSVVPDLGSVNWFVSNDHALSQLAVLQSPNNSPDQIQLNSGDVLIEFFVQLSPSTDAYEMLNQILSQPHPGITYDGIVTWSQFNGNNTIQAFFSGSNIEGSANVLVFNGEEIVLGALFPRDEFQQWQPTVNAMIASLAQSPADCP